MGKRRANVPGMPGITMPTGVDEDYASVYRGVIEDVNDPQQRKRLRVRVSGVFPPSVPVERLPWAEVTCLPAASLAGDFFPFSVGDRVYVMFEGGDRNKPLVTGGWIARPAALNDVPSDVVSEDYARTQRRWARVDRVGNALIMSEIPDEMFAKLVSGSASVTVDQKDGSVTLRAASGMVRTEGNSSETEVTFYALTSNQVLITADNMGKIGGEKGLMQFLCDFETSIHALGVDGTGIVRVGGYLPRFKGVAAPAVQNMGFKQTPLVDVCARKVKLGTAAGETIEGGQKPETETVSVDGVEVLITAKAATNSPSTKTVAITIDAEGDITIKSTTKVKIEAPEAEVSATNATITATGTAKVEGQTVDVDATIVTVDADEIDMTATTAIRMS